MLLQAHACRSFFYEVEGQRTKDEGLRSKDDNEDKNQEKPIEPIEPSHNPSNLSNPSNLQNLSNPSNPSNPLITPRTYRTHQTHRTYRTHQTHRNLLKEMFISVYRLEEDGGLLKEGAVWLTLGALRAQLL